MTRSAISTSGAPSAIGPYSQAIVSGDLVFCSGQLGLDPHTASSSRAASRPRPSGRCATCRRSSTPPACRSPTS